MPNGAATDDFPDVVRKPRPVKRTDGQSDLVPSAPSDAEDDGPVTYQNPAETPPVLKYTDPNDPRKKHFNIPSYNARHLREFEGAMERFNARQMYAGQQEQKRELNSDTQQVLKQQHVETERNLETGDVQPVRDEAGNVQYRPGKGPVQYDSQGKAVQTQYGTTGPKVVELDKDAPIAPHPERPNELYKQNKHSAWDYIGTVQEGLDSNDPAIKSAANDAQLGIDHRLHAAVSNDLGEEVNRRALIVRQKAQDFQSKAATLQTLNQQFDNFERDHPAVNETEGHFFSGGTRPTKTAQVLREQKAGLLKQIEELQSQGYSTDPKRLNEFTKVEREALAATHRERSAWQAAAPKEHGDFDRLIQDRTATLAEQGEDPSADPVLTSLEKRKAELGLGQPSHPEQDAQDKALREDPAYGPLMAERDHLAADHQKANEALGQIASEYNQRLEPIRQRIEQGHSQIAPMQTQVDTFTARLESLLGMPPAQEGEDLEARRVEAGNRITRLDDPKLQARVQTILNALEPAAAQLREAQAALQPEIDSYGQLQAEAQTKWQEHHDLLDADLAPRRQDLQNRFETIAGTRQAREANQRAIALKTPIANHIADVLGAPPPRDEYVTREPSYRVNSVTGQIHIDPVHPAAAISQAYKDGAMSQEDYQTAIPAAMAVEKAIIAAEAKKAQATRDAARKKAAPLDYRSEGGGTADEVSAEMLLTFYSDAVTAVDQIARSPIVKFIFGGGSPANERGYAQLTKSLHEHAQGTQALKDPTLQADWHVKAAGFLGSITPAMWSGGARAVEIPVLFSQGYQGSYDDASQFTESEGARVRSGIIGGLITSALSIVLGGAKANVGVPKTGFKGRLVEDGIDNAWKTGRVSGVLRYLDELKTFNLSPRDMAAIRPAVEKIRKELATAPLTAVKNVAFTALRDAGIGGGIQFSQNLAARLYDPERPLGENVLESAATFGAFGAAARSVGEARTARAARRDLSTFEQFAANTMRSRNPGGPPPIEPPETGATGEPGGGPKPPPVSGPPDIRAVHSEIDSLAVPGKSPEETAATQTALRALVKISQGEPIETLTAEEKRSLLAKHDESGLPRIELVKGPNGSVPVILDSTLERVRKTAPVTAQLLPQTEQEQRDKLFNITRQPAEPSNKTTKENSKNIPESELPTFSVDVQNASGEISAIEVKAETAEAAHAQVAAQIPQGQGLIKDVTQITSPEKITPRNFLETAVHQIREQKGSELTEAEDKSVRALARVIQPHYDRWQQAFDSVEVSLAPAESGGAALTRENALKLSIPDIISHHELYVKNPEHATNVVSEEAIHAVTAKLEDRDPKTGEARGPIDLVKIYRLLPEKLRTAMAGAYKAGGSDYNQAHEFWRMFMQGQLELARGGRIRLKGKFLQEQSSRPFVVENRKALARLMRYFRGMEAELRKQGTSEDVIQEVNRASALIADKIKEVDAHGQGLSESVAARETNTAPAPRSEPPARAPPPVPAAETGKPVARRNQDAVGRSGGNQPPVEQHQPVPPETEISRGAIESTAGTQLNAELPPSQEETETGADRGDLATGDTKQEPPNRSVIATLLRVPGTKAVGSAGRVTSNGRTLSVAYVAQEAEQARPSHDEQGRPTGGYDQTLQPRDRSLPAYRKQAQNIATNLEFAKSAFFPETSTPATTADLGAPIMTQGGDTLIGNGREIAIRLAYSQGSPAAAKYREDFIRNARAFGIDPALVRDMKQPILKRVVLDDVDKDELMRFSQESNEGAAMSSNAIEVAGRDATRLTPQLLSLFDVNYALDSAKNRPFMSAYVRNIVRGIGTANEANLTGTELERRVRSAIFSYAYGTDAAGRAALDRLSGDQSDPSGKTITSGLLTVAPIVARMKTDIASGDLFPLDISAAISRSAQDISETIRNKPAKQSTSTALADMRNQAALLDSDPLEKAVIDFLLDNRGSRQAIELGLSNYVEAVFKLGNPKNEELFGERKVPSSVELFKRATSSAALRGELSTQAIIESASLSPDRQLDALYAKYGNDAVEDALQQYWDEMGEMAPPAQTVSAEKGAKQSGEVLTPEKAHERWDDWRKQLDAIGKERGSENGGKIILSLFDRSGIWAEPFLRAGYDVRAIDLAIDNVDVMDINQEWLADYDMTEVHGVLAANPCTDFAGSGARWWKDKDEDGRTEASVKLVKHTLAIIEYLKPSFWALENPVGRLDELTGIGKPRLQFQPHNYGDPYTKRTQIWGNFNPELPLANVEPTEGSKVHKLRGDVPEQKDERSKTPEGFALAFAVANSNHGPAERVRQILESTSSGVPKLQPGEEQGSLPTGPVKSEAQLGAEGRERARALLRLQREQDLRLRAAKRLVAGDLTAPEKDLFAPPPTQGDLFLRELPSLEYDIADIRRLQQALENGKGERSDRLAAKAHRDQLLRQLKTLAGMEDDGAPVMWEDSAEHAAVFALADNPNLTWAKALAAGRKAREANIDNRIYDKEPVPIKAVQALNTDLPAGYRIEGDQYIYDPTWDSHPEEFGQAEKYVEGIGVSSDEVKKAADGIARTLSLVSDKDLASSYESNAAILRDFGRPPVAPRSPEASAKAVATRRENARQREVASHRAGLSALEQGDTEALNRAFEENKNRVSTIIPRLVKGDARTPVWNIVGSKIETPADMMMAAQMIRSPYVEMLKVAVLDRTNRVIGSEIVSIGSLNESIAHPREIFRLAVLLQEEYKDVRIIISHNHPSGDPSPSQSDHSLTRRLQEVAGMFKIKLLDHVITNGKKFYSFTGGSVDQLPERQIQPWEIAPGEDQPKLDSPEQVAKYAAALRSGDPEATHVFYLSTRYNLKAVERIPPIDPTVSQGSALSRLIMRGSSREGAYAVILDLPASQASPNLLLRRISENLGELYQVKVLDAMWPGMNSAREAGLLEEPPEYVAIRKTANEMPERMRQAMAGLLSGDSLDEVASSVGVSRNGVARLASEALSRIREPEPTSSELFKEAVEPDGKQPKEYSKSSTQVSLSEADAKPFVDFAKAIPENEIYTDPEDPTFGREEEPHVTLLYGITDADPSATARALLEVTGGKIMATAGKLSIFKTKKYDVLKADIDSPELHELNNQLQKKVPFQTDYPTYHPHLTIAYLKKGEGTKYVGDLRFEGTQLEFRAVDFRSKNGRKFTITLNPGPAATPFDAQLRILDNVVRTELKAQETNDPLKELMAVLDTDTLSDLYRRAGKEESGKFETGRPDLALGAEGASVRAAHQFHTDSFQAETIEGWDKQAEEHLSDPNWSRDFSQNIVRRYLSGDNLTAWETRAAMRLIAAESHTIGTPDEKLGHAVRAFAYARLRSKAGQELAAGRDPFKTPEERGREFLSKTFFRLPPEKEAEIEAEPDAERRQERLSAAMRERIDQLEKAFSYLAGKGITLDDIFNGAWELHGKGKKIIESEIAAFDVPRQHAIRLAQTGTRSAADIAKATGLTPAEVERVNDQFLDQLEKTLTAKVAAGLTLENIDLQGALLAQPSEPTPAANAKSPEEIKAEVRRIIRGMGFVASKDLGKFKVQKKKKPKLFVPPKPAGPTAEPSEIPFTGRVPDDSPVPFEPRRQNVLPFKPGDELRNVDRAPNESAAVPQPENQPAPYIGRVLGQIGLPLYQEMMIRKGADMGSGDDLLKLGRVAQSLDAKPFDMAYEAYINNIFSGIATHVANVSGNTISMAMDFTLQRGLESLLNTVYRDSDSPTFAEFKYIAKGILPGIVNGFKRGARAWDTESSVFSRDVLNEQIDLMEALDKAGGVPPAIPGATGRAVRIPVRALLFEDEIFKSLIGQMEVGGQAYRIAKKEGLSGEELSARMNELISTPGSEAWARAVEKAIYLTYQEPTGLTSLFRDQGKSAALGKMALKAEYEGRERTAQVLRTEEMVVRNLYRAASIFFPVVRTTYNIFKIGVGMANVAPTFTTIPYRFARAGFYRWRKGKPFVESYSKAQQIHDLARQVIAWTTFALLWSVTTGDEDDDKKLILFTGSMPYTQTKKGERELNERAYGGTYMLRIGGRGGLYIPYGRIEPIATVLGTVIDTITNIKKIKHGQSLAQTGDALLGYFLAQAQAKTFLSGFGDMTKAIEGSTSFTDIPKKLLFQALVPNLIRQPLRALDEWVRENKTASPLYQTLPTGELAEPKINPYGQPAAKGGNSFTRLFIAAGVRPDAELQKADRLLLNWNRLHPGDSWAPATPLTIYQDSAGKNHQMTAVEARKFLEASGKLAATRLRGQISEAQIQNPTEDDRDRIKAIFEEAHAQVKREMFPKNRVNLVKAWQKAA